MAGKRIALPKSARLTVARLQETPFKRVQSKR